MAEVLETYGDSSVICRQNEPGNDVFVLQEGKILVLVCPDMKRVPDKDDLAKARVVSEITKAGTMIGEASAWIGKRTATLMSSGTVKLKRLRMPPQLAEKMALERPAIGMNIANTLAQRIAETQVKSRHEIETLNMLEDARDAASMDVAKVTDVLEVFAAERSDEALNAAVAKAKGHLIYGHGESLKMSSQLATEMIRDVLGSDIQAVGLTELKDGSTLRKGGSEVDAAYLVVQGELDFMRGDRRVGGLRAGFIADIVPCLYTSDEPQQLPELRVKGDTKVVRLPKGKIKATCQKNPKLLLSVLRSLARELRTANDILGGAESSLTEIKSMLTGKTGSIVEISEQTLLPPMKKYPEDLRLEIDRISQNAHEVQHLLEMLGI